MLPLFNYTLALTIALAYLLALLLGPFLAAWFLLRIARDLRRVADASQRIAEIHSVVWPDAPRAAAEVARIDAARVSNSMFGR